MDEYFFSLSVRFSRKYIAHYLIIKSVIEFLQIENLNGISKELWWISHEFDTRFKF